MTTIQRRPWEPATVPLGDLTLVPSVCDLLSRQELWHLAETLLKALEAALNELQERDRSWLH